MQPSYPNLRFGFHGPTAFVVLAPTSYGSVEVDKLDELKTCVHQFVDKPGIQRVVIDLAQSTIYGAALLGILAESALHARSTSKQVVVAGDHLDLLSLTRLDRWITKTVSN